MSKKEPVVTILFFFFQDFSHVTILTEFSDPYEIALCNFVSEYVFFDSREWV